MADGSWELRRRAAESRQARRDGIDAADPTGTGEDAAEPQRNGTPAADRWPTIPDRSEIRRGNLNPAHRRPAPHPYGRGPAAALRGGRDRCPARHR